MATITGLTKARMLAEQAMNIVSGAISGDNLILTQRDGTQVNAGNVRGPKGDLGPTGPGIVTGMMFDWAGTSAPPGCVPTDGAALSRSTYSALFTAIGTKYGAGDGSTTFNVPDSTDCRMKSSATDSVANSSYFVIDSWATDTALGYSSKIGKYWSYSAGVFTFLLAGTYDISTQVTFATNALGPRYLLVIRKNGSENMRSDVTPGTRNSPATLNLAKAEYFDIGDTLSIAVYQTSGQALPLGATPGHLLEVRPRSLGKYIKT